jgi:hypothetical protein
MSKKWKSGLSMVAQHTFAPVDRCNASVAVTSNWSRVTAVVTPLIAQSYPSLCSLDRCAGLSSASFARAAQKTPLTDGRSKRRPRSLFPTFDSSIPREWHRRQTAPYAMLGRAILAPASKSGEHSLTSRPRTHISVSVDGRATVRQRPTNSGPGTRRDPTSKITLVCATR